MSGVAYQKRGMPSPRFDAILDALGDGRTVSVAVLAKELNVVERTVRRDLVALRELGHRIDGSTGRGGGVMLRTTA